MGAPLTTPTQAEQDFAKAFAFAAPVGEAKAAFERFAGAGLPSRRVESWHYTDLRAKLRAAPASAEAPNTQAIAAAKAKIPDTATLKIVTIDGFFIPELSSGLSGLAGVTLCEFSGDHAKASDPLLDLNSAFAPSGFFLEIAAGARIEKTLEILALAGDDPARARYGRGRVALRRGRESQRDRDPGGSGRGLRRQRADHGVGVRGRTGLRLPLRDQRARSKCKILSRGSMKARNCASPA